VVIDEMRLRAADEGNGEGTDFTIRSDLDGT
jgi:hypothetical protein